MGAILLLVAVGLVPTHLAEHAGRLDPLPGSFEDLLLGFPMAGVLGIGGVIALLALDRCPGAKLRPRRPHRPSGLVGPVPSPWAEPGDQVVACS